MKFECLIKKTMNLRMMILRGEVSLDPPSSFLHCPAWGAHRVPRLLKTCQCSGDDCNQEMKSNALKLLILYHLIFTAIVVAFII